MQRFAEKVMALRKLRGLTQEELCEQIGVTRQVIYRWEKGIASPSVDRLILISDYFNVSIDSLIRDEIEIEMAGFTNETTYDVTESDPLNDCDSISSPDSSSEKPICKVDGRRFRLLILILFIVFVTAVNVGVILNEQNTVMVSLVGLYTIIPLYIIALYFIIWGVKVIRYRIKKLSMEEKHEKSD